MRKTVDTRSTRTVPRRLVTGLALAVAAGLLTTAYAPALHAQAAPNAFPTCTLSTSVANGIAAKIKRSGIPAPQVDYIVVYTNDKSNQGQVVPGGTTGPVVCVNPARVRATDTTSDTPIDDITIIESSQGLQVQHQPTGGGDINTLLCAAYADVDKCKLIQPVAGPTAATTE